jgi:hypothetical protein
MPSVSIGSAFSRNTQQSGSGSDSPLGSVAVVTSPGQRLSTAMIWPVLPGQRPMTTGQTSPSIISTRWSKDPASQARTNSLGLQR